MFCDKIQQLDDHLDYDFDVIALTETWYIQTNMQILHQTSY